MAKSKTNPELERALSGMDKAYMAGSKDWFNYLADDVVVYSNSSGEPFKGKAAYMKHFGKPLVSAKRKIELLTREIQSMGDFCVVYQTVQVNQDNIIVNMKQSQVWTSTENGWKINHLHTAVLGSPQAKNPEGNLRSINVLNEKIASMASVVGVAQ